MDFNQTSPSSDSKGSRLIGLLVAIVVVLVIVALFVILSRNSLIVPTGNNAGEALTDEQKLEILNQLPEAENPLSDEEKLKVLEQVGASAQDEGLSDEEKIKILNSI